MNFPYRCASSVVMAFLLFSVSVAHAQVASTLNLPSNDADGRFTVSWPSKPLSYYNDSLWDNSYYECEDANNEGDCDDHVDFPEWLTVEQKYTLQQGSGSNWSDVYSISQSSRSDKDNSGRAKTLSYNFEYPYDNYYRFRLVITKSFKSSQGCGGASHCLPVGSYVVSTEVENPKLIKVNTGIKDLDTSGAEYQDITSNLTLASESRSGFYAIEYKRLNSLVGLTIEDNKTSLEYRKGTTGPYEELVADLSSSGHVVRDQEPGVYQYRVKNEIIYFDHQKFNNFVKAGYSVQRDDFVSSTSLIVYEAPKQIEVLAKELEEKIIFIQNGGISIPIVINVEREFPLEIPSQVKGSVDLHGNASLTWKAVIVESQTSYEIESYDAQTAKWNVIYRGLRTSYTASNLSVGRKQFRIRACTTDECSQWVPLAVVVNDVTPMQCLPFVIEQ